MPTTPYAKILVSVNGGANTSGGMEVASAATIQFSPESTVGWLRARWEIVDYPEGWATPVGWTLAADGAIYSTSFTPSLITLPANTVLWGKWFPRLLVNEQIDSSKDLVKGLIDTTTLISMLSPKGQRDISAGETTQMTSTTTRIKAWLRDLQRNLRALEAIAIGTPSGNPKTVQYNNTGVMGGIPELTYEGSGRIQLDIATGYLAYGSGAVPSSGMFRIPYSAGTQVIFNKNDVSATARSWIVFTGDNLRVGNSAGLAMDLQGTVVTITSAASMALNATTSIGLASTTTTTITATTTLSMTGTTGGFIAFGPTPATTGLFRAPSVISPLLVAGTKVLLATSATDLYIGVDSSILNGVTGYVRMYGGSGIVFGAAATNWGSIDSGGYCIAVNGQNWAFGTNVGSYGGGAGVGHWHAAGTNPTTNPTAGVVMYVDSASGYVKFRMASGAVAIVDIPDPSTMGLRLTLRTGESIPTVDTATSTNVFLTPHEHGSIMLYDATAGHWQLRITAEVTLALGTVTSGKNYDIWATWSGSAVVLSLSTAWTTDTARADAIARQDGVWVKSGTPALRYVGTIRTVSTTQTTDTQSQRYVWNLYNQIERYLYVEDTTANWTYNVASFRQVRATTTNKVEVVVGLVSPLHGEASIVQGIQTPNAAGTGIGGFPGVGLDSTTVAFTKGVASLVNTITVQQWWPATCEGDTIMGIGYHAINWLETCTSANTIAFFGLLALMQSHMKCRVRM